MGKAAASVDELVGVIERRELRLPEMQRRYVWRPTKVRDLLDSLYREYPSGIRLAALTTTLTRSTATMEELVTIDAWEQRIILPR